MTTMGGKIEVESKPDEGSAFHLFFKHTPGSDMQTTPSK